MTVPTRDRLVQTSAELFRRQGFAGTGVKQVLEGAGAPFGSLYHFFPGGKQQLAAAALRTGGAYFLGLYLAVSEASPDVGTTVSEFFAGAGDTVVASDFADSCPIATVASEVANTNDDLRLVCAEVFETWLTALVGDLSDAGLADGDARALGLNLLSLIEGAFLMARTLRSGAPMTAAGLAARSLVDAALLPDRAAGAGADGE